MTQGLGHKLFHRDQTGTERTLWNDIRIQYFSSDEAYLLFILNATWAILAIEDYTRLQMAKSFWCKNLMFDNHPCYV